MTVDRILMRAGLTLAHRRALRKQNERDSIIAARKANRSIACGDYGRHDTCVGERPGNGGCLCECHDDAGGAGMTEQEARERRTDDGPDRVPVGTAG